MAISAEMFRNAMTLFPGAVTLITTGEGEGRRGITATAVCSVTDSPPSLLACVNRKTETRDTIAGSGRFSVQLLPADARGMALHFAGAGGVRGAARFGRGEWSACPMGLPRLKEALASLSCTVTDSAEIGSHTVFIGRIDHTCLADGEALVYAQAQFRRLATVA